MVSIAFSCALLSAALIALPAAAGIDWITGTWDDVLGQARSTHRPIMALFFKPTCEPCVMFDSVLTTPEIVAYAGEFVCVKFDKDEAGGKSMADRFKVMGSPVTVFFDWKGVETDRLVGGSEGPKLLGEMKRIRSGRGTVPDLLARESKHREDVEFNALLGEKLSLRGDPRAGPYLERVLALDSTNVKGRSDDALFNLSRIARLDGDFASGAALLERMLQSYPNSELESAARVSLAGCYRKLGQNERAAAVLRTTPVKTMLVSVTSANGRHVFNVEVASTATEQNLGLMFRQDIAKDGGMIFTPYPPDGGPPSEASFWMKDTPTALDIIFIRADGTIVRIVRNAVPFSTTPILSGKPVAAVLEIPGGRSTELGITEGDTVSWGKP